MPEKPSEIPDWATELVSDPVSGQVSRLTPPIEKQENGWLRLERPPYNWMNWLQWLAGRWIRWVAESNVVTDGNGDGVAPVDDAIVILYAVNMSDVSEYLHAVGYKEEGEDVVFTVIANNVLGLGTAVGSNQPITGAGTGSVKVYARSEKEPS